jgi:hypothetical protein
MVSCRQVACAGALVRADVTVVRASEAAGARIAWVPSPGASVARYWVGALGVRGVDLERVSGDPFTPCR